MREDQVESHVKLISVSRSGECVRRDDEDEEEEEERAWRAAGTGDRSRRLWLWAGQLRRRVAAAAWRRHAMATCAAPRRWHGDSARVAHVCSMDTWLDWMAGESARGNGGKRGEERRKKNWRSCSLRRAAQAEAQERV